MLPPSLYFLSLSPLNPRRSSSPDGARPHGRCEGGTAEGGTTRRQSSPASYEGGSSARISIRSSLDENPMSPPSSSQEEAPSSPEAEEQLSSCPMSPATATAEVPEASDRTRVEAKEVRLSDMVTIALGHTDMQIVPKASGRIQDLKMSDEHTSSRPMLLVAATPEICISLKDNRFIKAFV